MKSQFMERNKQPLMVSNMMLVVVLVLLMFLWPF